MALLEGKKLAEKIHLELAERSKLFSEKFNHPPCLSVILVGEDPASQVYVNSKIKACAKADIKSLEFRPSGDIGALELKKMIQDLNEDPKVHGILVQLPLPKHLSESEVIGWIRPEKDVDGLSIQSMGQLLLGQEKLVSCTPKGVIRLLNEYQIPIEGKSAVVIGRSNIVGKPMALLLQAKGATVTVAHSKTKDLKSVTQNADILVVAIGRAKFIGKDYVKKGSVVVDVGIHRQTSGEGKAKLCGDVNFDELKDWADFITPVPGGVGPMTIAMLLENTLEAAEAMQN